MICKAHITIYLTYFKRQKTTQQTQRISLFILQLYPPVEATAHLSAAVSASPIPSHDVHFLNFALIIFPYSLSFTRSAMHNIALHVLKLYKWYHCSVYILWQLALLLLGVNEIHPVAVYGYESFIVTAVWYSEYQYMPCLWTHVLGKKI